MYNLLDKETGKQVFSSSSYYEIIKEKNKRRTEGQETTIQEELTKMEKIARKETARIRILEKLKKININAELLKKKEEEEEEGSEITEEELDDFEEAVMGKEFRGK